MPAQEARLPALDVLRAVGALCVLAVHVGVRTGAVYRGLPGGVLARLDVGVAIFFVLSGFLLFRPFVVARAEGLRRPSAGRYLWRRALRILPAYWLAVTACLLLLPPNKGTPPELWVRFFTLTQIYIPFPLAPGLYQAWTLATEASFYVVLPVLALVALGRRWRPRRTVVVTVALAVLALLAWLVVIGGGHLPASPAALWLPMYLLWFAAGMALATAHVALRTGTAPAGWRVLDRLSLAPLACWIAAVGLLVVAGTPVGGGRDVNTFGLNQLAVKVVLFTAVATLVVVPAAFGPPTRAKLVLGNGVLRWLGAMSYGVFLWHPFVLEAIYEITDRPVFGGGFIEVYLMTGGFALALAVLSYYVVERPLLRLSPQWRRRRSSDAVEAGPDGRQPQGADGEQTDGLRPADVVGIGGVH